MSVPHSNSTQTTEMPTAVAERTRRTFAAPFIDASIGNETRVSTSTGAMPWASVMTVTVGAVRSGKTSTGMLVATYPPSPIRRSERAMTSERFWSERRMMELSIVPPPQWVWPWAGMTDETEARRMA